MTGTRVVVALGGNALLRRGESAEAATQKRNVLEAASALAPAAAPEPVEGGFGVPSPGAAD